MNSDTVSRRWDEIMARRLPLVYGQYQKVCGVKDFLTETFAARYQRRGWRCLSLTPNRSGPQML